MPNIQPIHLILVLIVALVIFGPSRLPQLGKSLGESITEFRQATRELTNPTQQPAVESNRETEAPTPEKPAPPKES